MTGTNTLGREVVFHRYYDPATGGFLSVDPALDVTGQPYQYVRDDPVNRTDPTGQMILGPSGETCANAAACGAVALQYHSRGIPWGCESTLKPASGAIPVYLQPLVNHADAGLSPSYLQPLVGNPPSNSGLSALGSGFVASGGAIGASELAGAGIEGLGAASGAYAAGEIGTAAFIGASIASGGLIAAGGLVITGTVIIVVNFF